MIRLSGTLLEEIRRQARDELPNEACGYLVGLRDGVGDISVSGRIPMTNIDRSPEHFSFDPKEQFAALRQARDENVKLVATYHSHPETPARLSDEDIRLANDPDSLYLIYSVLTEELKGFSVDRNKESREVEVEIVA